MQDEELTFFTSITLRKLLLLLNEHIFTSFSLND